jgi:hypothetical protein
MRWETPSFAMVTSALKGLENVSFCRFGTRLRKKAASSSESTASFDRVDNRAGLCGRDAQTRGHFASFHRKPVGLVLKPARLFCNILPVVSAGQPVARNGVFNQACQHAGNAQMPDRNGKERPLHGLEFGRQQRPNLVFPAYQFPGS